jgi:hypothetical protein
MEEYVQNIWQKVKQNKLSGWARLWIVILSPFWLFGITIEYNSFSDLADYNNQERSFLQNAGKLLEIILSVSFWVLVFFIFAMLAKWAGVWVWRGFKQPKPTDTDTQ